MNTRVAPDNRAIAVAVVVSGTTWEVHERRNGYVRARARDGREGRIGAAHVTEDPPAKTRLAALGQKHTKP